MATDRTRPEVLISVPNEMEAAAIVGALEAQGIHARAVGGYTAGFLAEAPGEVKVIVGRADLARAREVLAEIESEPAEIDWSKVDFGDGPESSDEDDASTTPDAEAASERPRPAAGPRRRPFQFSIWSLLVLQTVVSVVLAVWRGYHEGLLSGLVLFCLIYVPLVTATFALLVAGTVEIASDLTRARQAWRYVGRALSVGAAVVVLFVVIARILEALGVTF